MASTPPNPRPDQKLPAVRKRSPSEVLRRGYSDEEILDLYNLGVVWLEAGDLRRAEAVMLGLTAIATDYSPPWLGLAYIHFMNARYDETVASARQALRIDPESVPAMLFLVATHLVTNDSSAAGTYLGEIQERVDSGVLNNQSQLRLFKAQLARFQALSQQ